MSLEGTPAIFLDRDGVINWLMVKRGPRETPLTPDELQLLPGAKRALQTLKGVGVPLVVVTNQPNVAKGKTTRELNAAIEERLHQLLGNGAAVDAVYTCLHHPDPRQVVVPELCRDCDCRKPKPGLLLMAARERGLALDASIMIGDSASDVAAGRAAGCRTILLHPTAGLASGGADVVASDLLAAVPYVLHLLHENIY